ncbi:MAG: TRAP transporter small permease [Candidatus Vecturithrix sp.]|nr:TRAP transporter small permease [Candidatus Vecturithrix sp.]
MNIFVKIDRFIASFTKNVAITCFVGLMVVLAAVVFVRFFPIVIIGWSDEVIEWLFAWMVFMGAAHMWRAGQHFRIKFWEDRYKGKSAATIFNSIAEILSIIFLGVMTYYGYQLMINAHNTTEVLVLPRHAWYLCIPVSGVIMIAYSIRNVLQNFGVIAPSASVRTTEKLKDEGGS